MNSAVSELVEKALRLPAEDRAELLEAIWENELPSDDFITDQLAIIEERMKQVKNGTSSLTPADEAHRLVRESLRKTS